MSTTPAPTPADPNGGDPRGRVARERRFSRRIECDGAPAEPNAGPARGGGMRDPGEWQARGRDTR